MSLSYSQDQKMRKAFAEKFPETDIHAEEVEWDIDRESTISYAWNFSIKGVSYKQVLDKKSGNITLTKVK